MPLFIKESEDALLSEKDMKDAQLQTGYGANRVFGAWALMRSSMAAENRERRAVARKRRSLEREQRRLERLRQLRIMARTMFNGERNY